MALAYTSSTANSGLGLIVRFSGAVLAGLVSYMVVVLLSQRSVSRRAEKSGRLG
jgi:ABC-type thiamin/hydroxymethylpyrimidine transport system permease subunit